MGTEWEEQENGDWSSGGGCAGWGEYTDIRFTFFVAKNAGNLNEEMESESIPTPVS